MSSPPPISSELERREEKRPEFEITTVSLCKEHFEKKKKHNGNQTAVHTFNLNNRKISDFVLS